MGNEPQSRNPASRTQPTQVILVHFLVFEDRIVVIQNLPDDVTVLYRPVGRVAPFSGTIIARFALNR
jgi:hypothetical protein